MAVARLPHWVRKPFAENQKTRELQRILDSHSLNTVCRDAACPNRWECFSAGSVTFMVLGNVCTRRCRFCGVRKGVPAVPDREEPARLARAARELGLEFVVVTSVTRDDLSDGGAGHFARCVEELKRLEPRPLVEVLVPDFGGHTEHCSLVLASAPDVFSHNVETVPRLYSRIRPGADYAVSLRIIEQAARHEARPLAKSGLMVGLGETEEEVMDVLRDLSNAGCRSVTVGQYLKPSLESVPVARYVPPETFRDYEDAGRELGFAAVFAGPLVRSSYKAHEIWRKINGSDHPKQEFPGEPSHKELRRGEAPEA
ncbi:MAG: lipoyl synthase [Candidatus Eisenbacteria bacterium]|nr:lipoyl synthase [Candidatus Eisenbacteria bacterium]